MNVVRIILSIILGLDCLALVVLVLMQQGKSAGLSGAIAGGAETFFGKKKAASYEGKMELLTKITGTVFMVLAVVLVILQRFA
ncbi:MAG: preprotein translocase subunit SecG [Candidatus Spyradocola sp.]|nr:preprotein translocase subunit SecG [Candidatus Spyradocola sp.]